MHQLIDKSKYLIYIFFFLMLSTFNNLSFKNSNLFKVQHIQINQIGKDENFKIKESLNNNLNDLKDQNIFFIKKNQIKNLINDNEWVLNFSAKKKYPSKLIINFEKAETIANIIQNDETYFLGSNFKLIKSESIDRNLPNIFGNPGISDLKHFFEKLYLSEINLTEIMGFYYLKSGRWDIKTKNNILIKLPKENNVKFLNLAKQILESDKFISKKIINLSVKNQIIVH